MFPQRVVFDSMEDRNNAIKTAMANHSAVYMTFMYKCTRYVTAENSRMTFELYISITFVRAHSSVL